MSLFPGARVGPYEIVSPLGAGGMGEVYRARDMRLHRDVAIKVLLAGSDTNRERLARFEQEARAAAALNHPNIVSIYDVGVHDNAPYIVSELVEGTTLAERLREGELPLRKAVDVAVQIAHGLAAAHARDIVHRDLKPANVFITPDGRAKILDFGLAKLTAATSSSAGATSAPSLMATTPVGTTPGLIFGTVGYMAPEQVRGHAVDHRADIFAFGVVLYEMVTGQRAFERETPPETMTAILREDVPEAPLAVPQVPAALARIIRRCVEKDPAMRFQSALDLAFALEATSAPSSVHSGVVATLGADAAKPTTSRAMRWRERAAWALAAVAVVTAVAATMMRPRSEVEAERPLVRFPLPLPKDVPELSNYVVPSISPDGRHIAYAEQGRNWVQSLDRSEPQIVGIRASRLMFWSSDSRTLAFTTTTGVIATEVPGGTTRTLCEMPTAFMRGGTWSQDGVIVIGTADGGLFRCGTNGGPASPLTRLNSARGETGHYGPAFLPDGKHVIYWTQPSKAVSIVSIDGGEPRELLTADSAARYMDPGLLVFARKERLVAQPFDASTATLHGEAVPIVERVYSDPGLGLGAAFDASRNGVIAYRNGSLRQTSQLTWFDRSGRAMGTVGPPGVFRNPNLSPDGKQVAIETAAADGTQDVALIDVMRNVLTRFTFDESNDVRPIWSGDGEWVAFASDRGGTTSIYRKRANGGGREELLLKADPMVPHAWTRDGTALVYQRASPPTLGILSLAGAPTTRLIDESRSRIIDGWAQLSPDGRWLAYSSEESGRYQVHVQSFPSPDNGKWQVSSNGGFYPRWAGNGRELFYLSGDGQLMAVPVRGDATLDFGVPQALFTPNILYGTSYGGGREQQFDVSPDGQRFLITVPVRGTSVSPVNVLLNWKPPS